MVTLRLAVRTIALGLLGAALLGCERKAPGPDECARFAEAVVHLATDEPFLTPALQAQIDDQTRLCLTRPYDRELLNCVLMTNRAKPCLETFHRRTGQRE